MIISVEQAKTLIDVKNCTDANLERKLKAIEQTIRRYTNNNFQKRTFRKTADIVGGLLYVDDSSLFSIGDTVEITESTLNEGLYTVVSSSNTVLSLEEEIKDENCVLLTKVEYPEDVIDCALNLLEWDINNRSKVGIKSETLSRHSVTYEDSSTMFLGYPIGILNGVKLHRKARF